MNVATCRGVRGDGHGGSSVNAPEQRRKDVAEHQRRPQNGRLAERREGRRAASAAPPTTAAASTASATTSATTSATSEAEVLVGSEASKRGGGSEWHFFGPFQKGRQGRRPCYSPLPPPPHPPLAARTAAATATTATATATTTRSSGARTPIFLRQNAVEWIVYVRLVRIAHSATERFLFV